MLDDMTSEELSEWMAYDRLDPVGEFRGDIRAGIISSVVANIARQAFGKKGTKKTQPMDFMPDWDGNIESQRKKPQSVDEMKGTLRQIADIFKKGDKKEEQHQKKERKTKKRE